MYVIVFAIAIIPIARLQEVIMAAYENMPTNSSDWLIDYVSQRRSAGEPRQTINQCFFPT